MIILGNYKKNYDIATKTAQWALTPKQLSLVRYQVSGIDDNESCRAIRYHISSIMQYQVLSIKEQVLESISEYINQTTQAPQKFQAFRKPGIIKMKVGTFFLNTLYQYRYPTGIFSISYQYPTNIMGSQNYTNISGFIPIPILNIYPDNDNKYQYFSSDIGGTLVRDKVFSEY